MDNAKINEDFNIQYPTECSRNNSCVIGLAVKNKNYGAWYSYFGSNINVTIILGNNIIVQTYVDAYVGKGAEIYIILFQIK